MCFHDLLTLTLLCNKCNQHVASYFVCFCFGIQIVRGNIECVHLLVFSVSVVISWLLVNELPSGIKGRK